MAIRGSKQKIFAPQGLTDAFDESDSFLGACQLLQNLIFDSSNPQQVIARPGVGAPVTSFAGFTAPTAVVVHASVGNLTYGMVSTGRFGGSDEPFVYDNIANVFTPVSGVTSGNVPTTQPIGGEWTPPVISAVGTKILITHAGFSGSGGTFFGVLDVSNPNAPAWSTANTSGNSLPSVPTAVGNFNNRAYYACGNVLYFSDSLSPLVMTNGTQNLTIGDMTPVTGLVGLPIETSSSGILGMLAVFKANQVWVVQGDVVNSNLSLNFASLAVGSPSPRSIVQTPIGIVFVGQDAPYILTQAGSVVELTNPSSAAADIRAPFQNAQTRSRITAAYAGNIYRVCLTTTVLGVVQTNDYWFDLRRMRWCGPHTFVYDCASQLNGAFFVSNSAAGAALFRSAANDTTLNTVYDDNGTPLLSNLVTANLSDDEAMAFKQTIETTADLASGGISVPFSIIAQDEYGNPLSSATIVTPSPTTQWGNFNWGDGTTFSAGKSNPYRYDIEWAEPIVWDRLSLNIKATSSSDVTIGKIKVQFQTCGYALRNIPVPNYVVQPGSLLDVNFILNQSVLQ